MEKNQQPLTEVLEALARSSPILAPAAPLLAEAATPVAGLPPLKDLRDRPEVGKLGGDLGVAQRLSSYAEVVAKAAPDLAVLAPAVAPRTPL